MNRTNYLRDVFFYHQSNAGLIMHSMQEFKQRGQWLDKGLSRIIMNISDNYGNDDNAYSHREQYSHTAPDLPPATGSCQSRYPLREMGDLGPCLSTSNPTQIIGECAYQFIDTLLSGLVSKYWDTFSTFSSRIQYHLSDIPYTIHTVMI